MMTSLLIRAASAWIALTALLFVAAACERLEGPSGKEQDFVLKVGERGISIEEYREALKRLLPEGASGMKSDELRSIKMNLLDQIIEEELIVQEAARLGIEVSENELAREVRAIKKGYAKGAFAEAITARYGDMQSWREEIKRKLLIKKVVEKVIESKIEGTEEEARVYYEENISDYEIPDQVRARMILVKTEEEAKAARKMLRKEDFAEVAREVSISPEAGNGGDLGFFSRGEMPEEFEEAVFGLRKGQISKIIQTPYGYHIFRVEEKKKGRKLKFEDVKEKIMEKLRREKADMEFRRWMISLRQTARIEIREHLL